MGFIHEMHHHVPVVRKCPNCRKTYVVNDDSEFFHMKLCKRVNGCGADWNDKVK